MSDRHNKTYPLAQHSAALVTQIALQRRDIARQAAALRSGAHFIDKVRDSILYIRHHREVLLLPLALLIVSRPRRIVAFFLSTLGAWRVIQNWRHSVRR